MSYGNPAFQDGALLMLSSVGSSTTARDAWDHLDYEAAMVAIPALWGSLVTARERSDGFLAMAAALTSRLALSSE